MTEFWDALRANDTDTNAMFGPMFRTNWRDDPKGLVFQLARYKFAAKMLTGKGSVVEVGCGDGTGIPLLLQSVSSVAGIDVDARVLADNGSRFAGHDNVTFIEHDFAVRPFGHRFDAGLSLDVLEHIPHEAEQVFLSNIVQSLKQDAVFVLGTPNITFKPYETAFNQQEHINMQSAASLRELMGCFFQNTFIFSMNDEIVHTGFHPMAAYLFAVGVCLR